MIPFLVFKEMTLCKGTSKTGLRICEKGCPYFTEIICSETSTEINLMVINLHNTNTKIIAQEQYITMSSILKICSANIKKTKSNKIRNKSPYTARIVFLRLFIFIV